MTKSGIYEHALEHLPIGVVMLDHNKVVSHCNSYASHVLGLSTKELMGKKWEEVFQVVDTKMDPYQNKEKSEFKEWATFLRHDGSKIPIQKHENYIVDENGQSVGTLISIEDISSEQHYIHKLERAREQAEEAAKIKTNFLANMSHELRTPLNAILGMSELAKDLSVSKEQIEYLSILRTSAENLHQLISSLLDYVKLESGQANLAERGFNLYSFIENISSTFALAVHSKGLSFHVDFPPELDLDVFGDETRLRQVVVNLLTNAIKFTDKGEIILSLKLMESKLNDTIVIEWEVRDSGIGIALEDIGKIFEPFVQIDGSSTRSAGGTGIGLSITKGLVELMHGSITVHSAINQGSRFTFTTRFKTNAAVKTPTLDKLDCSNIEIVMLSSSKYFTESVRPWFSKVRAKITYVENFEDLVEAINKSEDTPLLLCQGTKDFASQICKEESQEKIKRIFSRRHVLSLNILRQNERYWRTAGFDYETVLEPLRPKKLLSLIQMLDAEYQSQKEQASRNDYRSPIPVKILYVEDEPISAIAQTHLLQGAGHEVMHADNGRSALKMIMEHKVDLVILDIEMPEMNGYEVASAIRGGELGLDISKVPLIALTAHSSPSDIKHAELIGINAFLSKPFFPQSLLYTIDRIISDAQTKAQKPLEVNSHDEDIPSHFLTGIDKERVELLKKLILEGKTADAEVILIAGREYESMQGNVDQASELLKILFKLRSSQLSLAIDLLTSYINVSESKRGVS